MQPTQTTPEPTTDNSQITLPVGNPTYIDRRGREYEIDRETKAHRRLTPKPLSKRERRRIHRMA